MTHRNSTQGKTRLDGAAGIRLPRAGAALVSVGAGGTYTITGTIVGTAGAYGTQNGAGGGTGVLVGAGGTLSNSGNILGGTGGQSNLHGGTGGTGVDASAGGSIDNEGLIAGGDGGATFNAGASAVGATGGTGVTVAGGTTLRNNGTIRGGTGGFRYAAGLGFLGGPGGAGVYANGGTITNAGVIAGGDGGPQITGPSGAAVSFGATASRLIVEAGASFIGAVTGDGVNDVLQLDTGAPGTLTGLGSQITGFSSIEVTADSAWTLPDTATIAAGETLSVAGTLNLPSGLTVSGEADVSATGTLSGIVEVTAGGIIGLSGSLNGTLRVDAFGILSAAGASNINFALENYSQLQATTIAGLVFHGAFASTNDGMIFGTNASPASLGYSESQNPEQYLRAGGTGVQLADAGINFVNSGLIQGGGGGSFSYIDYTSYGRVTGVGQENGGVGLIAGPQENITNTGTISGGTGGQMSWQLLQSAQAPASPLFALSGTALWANAPGTIFVNEGTLVGGSISQTNASFGRANGGGIGAYVGAGATLHNYDTISGGDSLFFALVPLNGAPTADGGDGVVLNGGTLSTSGTISAGIGLASARYVAVRCLGDTSTLQILPGASWFGDIQVGSENGYGLASATTLDLSGTVATVLRVSDGSTLLVDADHSATLADYTYVDAGSTLSAYGDVTVTGNLELSGEYTGNLTIASGAAAGSYGGGHVTIGSGHTLTLSSPGIFAGSVDGGGGTLRTTDLPSGSSVFYGLGTSYGGFSTLALGTNWTFEGIASAFSSGQVIEGLGQNETIKLTDFAATSLQSTAGGLLLSDGQRSLTLLTGAPAAGTEDVLITGGTGTTLTAIAVFNHGTIVKTSAGGILGGGGTSTTLDLGSVRAGGAALSASLAASGGSFPLSGVLTASGSFAQSGFGAFAGLVGAQTGSAGTLTLGTDALGQFTETVVMSGTAATTLGAALLAPLTLTVTGTVTGISISSSPGTFTNTAAPNTFVATDGVLQAGDAIQGGGTDWLLLSGNGQFNLAAPKTLTGVTRVLASERQNAPQTVIMRAGLNVTVDVTSGNPAAGNTAPERITIIGAADKSTFNLAGGTDTVVLGAKTETVHAGGGTALITASAATAGAAITNSTVAGTTLTVTGGGKASLNAGDTNLTVVLGNATSLTTGKLGFITVDATAGKSIVTAGGANQTLIAGPADQLIGALAGNDTFVGKLKDLVTARIGNWVNGDVLDVGGLNAATLKALTYVNGKLGLSDGTASGRIAIAGPAGTTLTASNFTVLGGDGHGGVLIGYHG